MLRIRSWAKWQRGIISTVRKSRETRQKNGQDVDMDAPLSMQHISIATSWDRDFVDGFGQLVGQRNAETYFLRVLQYVALHDGFTGECPVDREEFGEIVLSRRRDRVSRKEGEKVYDALVASGLAEQVASESRSVTHSARVQDPTRARVPLLARTCPDSPPPSCLPTGGSASPSPNETTPPDNPERANTTPPSQPDDRPLSLGERDGVLAACGALIGQRDIDPAVRDRAKSVDRLVRSGMSPPAAVREFVRQTVMARKESRIAYLGASRGVA